MLPRSPALALITPAARKALRVAAAVPASVLQVISERSAFDRLEAEWVALETSAQAAVVFQSYAWCRAVWDHWSDLQRPFEPRILVARDQGRIVGILPMKIAGRGPLRIATGFGEPFQQYTEALLAGPRREEVAASLVAAALRLPGLDGVEFLKVRDESPLAAALAARGATQSNADAAPFVDLRPFAAFEDYHATVNAKTRKNMRNSRNRLSRSARLEHRVLTDPDEIGGLALRAHAGRERWLSQVGLTSRAFREPSFAEFAKRLACGQAGVTVLAMSLELDGAPIADQWGFVFNGRYYAYVATWDPAFEESSPGKLQLEDVIRVCHAGGLGIADFLMPAVRYKLTWTDQAMGVSDYAVSLSWRGRLHRSLWTGRVRPVLKRAMLALPKGVRSRLTSVVFGRNRERVADNASAPRA